jgi:hypothetical protein
MFLRCRIKFPEIWMLTNPEPRSARRRWTASEPKTLDRKFRTVSASEVKSGDWKKGSGETEHLFTPVTLSPFLPKHNDLASFYIEGWAGLTFYSVPPTGVLAQHSTLRNTYLTDPPGKDCVSFIEYEARTSSSESLRISGSASIRSDRTLVFGDIIDCTLAPRPRVFGEYAGRIAVAGIIRESEKL